VNFLEYLLIVVMVCWTIFLLQALVRAVYIHLTEFMPAVRQFEEVKKAFWESEGRDEQQMLLEKERAIYRLEEEAHRRTFEVFWFLRKKRLKEASS
jgi:hypothetical protein